MLFKIQVGNAFDGKPLTTEQAIRRWLGLGQFLSAFAFSIAAVGLIGALSLVWSLVLLLTTISSSTKQGAHDRFANSAVVRQADAGNGLVYTCLIVVFALPVLVILALLFVLIAGGQISDILSAVGTSVQQP
jgi:RDD family